MNSTVKRSISGAVFLAVMLGGLLVNRLCFNILFAFISCVMVLEFLRITLGKAHRPVRIATAVVAVLAFVSVGLVTGVSQLDPKWLSLNLIFLILLMVLMILDHTQFKDYAYVFSALLYIAVPLALSHFVVSSEGVFDGRLMLAFFIVIWASDVGAYCFGMLLGQRVWPAKMCPDISPKKSWAGFFGGLITAVAAAVIMLKTGLIGFPTIHVLVMAILMSISGVFGDLFESLWKRQFGVKDSGNIIPGHGGLLDRFDSSLFAIPTGYVYLLLNGLL